MELISSDTNVWIDFLYIDKLTLPFKLPYTYIMFTESIDNELINPIDLKTKLRQAGLVGVDITTEEFLLADQWGTIYPKLSVPDRIALAIAKSRSIPLLTGDGALRIAAQKEGVPLMGTIRILDMLYEQSIIALEEYRQCLTDLLNLNGKARRLPTKAIQQRIDYLNQL